MHGGGDFQRRIEAVLARVDIVALIGGALGWRPKAKRGKCPFHGSKSESLAVYPEIGRAKCWGCDWRGDAIGFVQDYYGFDFRGALERIESDNGIDPDLAEPVQRRKVERQWQGPETVDSAIVGAHLWRVGVPDFDSLRVWLRARKVPEAMLGEEWLGGLRFCPSGPIGPWKVSGVPGDVGQAPAMLGLIRGMDADRRAHPIGVHATFLSPGLRAKMNRKRSNGSKVPARKMFGGSGGGFVVLGTYRRDCPLYVGEGIETVLSGMALAGAPADACGLAVLSLNNLQGGAQLLRNRALPLWNLKSDPQRAHVAFAHDGPVVGLIDADMKPLTGPIDRETGELRGVAVTERPGGPVVHREITTAERAEICAALFAQNWRAAGCRRVSAIRPAMGMDFNDAARECA